MDVYRSLSRAQLSAEYLHTNSTTHEFLFGAMAEMVDNARDAGASKIEIFAVENPRLRGGFHINFLDDGCGMNLSEAASVITFGKSLKRGQDSKIGHYGNGLKSGTMRLGNDMMVFTKKDDSQTCVFLSRTFLEEEKLDAVLVPLPTFKINTRVPYNNTSEDEKQKLRVEMDIILKFSPFHTEAEFFKQFDAIKKKGTLVVVYNMKLRANGDPELDISAEGDILLRDNEDKQLEGMPEYYSLRAYTSILYHEPRMKIYIQGKKVHTCRLAYSLCKPRSYNFSSARFRSSSAQDLEGLNNEVKVLSNKLLEAKSKMSQLAKESFSKSTDRNLRAKYLKAVANTSQIQDDHDIKKRAYEIAQKSIREPKNLKFIYGLNIADRRRYGMFVYNCGRLIKMYQRVGPQLDDGLVCKGVLGIVDIPFSVLAPTHNKQDFTDAHEYKLLLRALGEHLEQYWADLDIDKTNINKFWTDYGYVSESWKNPPSEDVKYARKRAMNCKTYIQCDSCLKWRALPFSSKMTKFSSDWSCKMNPDQAHNKCSHMEEIWNCPEGKLVKSQRGVKTKEDLEKDIRKCEKKLNLLKKEMPNNKKEESTSNALNTRTRSRGFQNIPSPKPRETESRTSRNQEHYPIRKLAPRRSVQQPANEVRLPVASHPQPPRRKRVVMLSDSEEEEEEDTIPKKKSKPLKPAPNLENRTKKIAEAPKQESRSSGRVSFKKVPKENEKKESQPVPTQAKRRRETREATPEPESVEDKASRNLPSPESMASLTPGQHISVLINEGQWANATVKEVKGASMVVDVNSALTLPITAGGIKLLMSVPEVSSSTSDIFDKEAINKIIKDYKTCLCYFLPPSQQTDEPLINGYTPQELADFDIGTFFRKYEEGLRSFTAGMQEGSDKIAARLEDLHRLVLRFLILVDEDANINPNGSVDYAISMLKTCINQMEQEHLASEP